MPKKPNPELEPESPPEGWEQLRPADHPDGPPVVGFDPKSCRNYHVEGGGRIIFHEVPEGFAFDVKGWLRPTEERTGEVRGTPDAPLPTVPLLNEGDN